MPSGSDFLDAGTSLLGGVASAFGASRQRSFIRKEAKKNRDFQERMSSTAHARAVADLRNAGLNPILAARSPASSPGGAQAGLPPNVAGEGVSSAIAVRRNRQELRNMKATQKNTDMNTELTYDQMRKTSFDANSAREHYYITQNERELSDKLKLLDARIYGGKYGEMLRRAQLLSSPVSSAAGVGRLFK